ncbi:MAG: pyridoxal-phosphate dependent enzyme [Anaerolineales bacterium]
MIDLTTHQTTLEKTITRARERAIYMPTYAMMKDPQQLPAGLRTALGDVGLWDVNPLNLARITWKNEPTAQGGRFGGVNFLEIPPQISGVPARIITLVGKWFPTGAHKVGATYGCLAPALVTGQFDPTRHKAVWPSTGNYCRGGAYNSALLDCDSVAILPEGMSSERFDWLKSVAGEVIATYGTESNVKEIFDKVKELKATREDVFVFDQFQELGNHLWHYDVTGAAMLEVLSQVMAPRDRLAGFVAATGSAGTIGAGDRLKEHHPMVKIGASEALQCPTLLYNGFGAHRIEGIGDKHIPWIHNVRNTDMVMGIDDSATIAVMRLFNEPAGRDYLAAQGTPQDFLDQLDLFGISCIGNLLSAIKLAKWYELGPQDVVITVNTDSMELYGSRVAEERAAHGDYTPQNAAADYHRWLLGTSTDHVEELGYYARKRIHNLKYFTWIEQQGKDLEELDAQWYDRDYWDNVHKQVDDIDRLIADFNARVGLYPEG